MPLVEGDGELVVVAVGVLADGGEELAAGGYHTHEDGAFAGVFDELTGIIDVDLEGGGLFDGEHHSGKGLTGLEGNGKPGGFPDAGVDIWVTGDGGAELVVTGG